MANAQESIQDFAEKIAKFCTGRGIKVLLEWLEQQKSRVGGRSEPMKGMHLPFIDIASSRKKARISGQIPGILSLRPSVAKATRIKQLKTISVDLLFRVKPLSDEYKALHEAAFDAHTCCRSLDLHLLRLHQIYEEKRLSLKDVVDWRLPKSGVFEENMQYYVDQIKSLQTKNQNHHHITLIIIGKQAQDKKVEQESQSAQLELVKQQKERRNYVNTKNVF